jgi:rare lipoprotein A
MSDRFAAWETWMVIGFAFAGPLISGPAHGHDTRKFSGLAAYYSKDYRGKTASGAPYDPAKFTCAHRTLPFGTLLRITDQHTHRSIIVTVNDRGPFTKGRVLDLSLAAAKALHMSGRGVIEVTATVQ